MNIIIKIVKILDLAYISIIYCFFAVILSIITRKILYLFPKKSNEDKSIYLIVIEVIAYSWYIAVLIYMVRNLVKKIPSPLNKIYGFSHNTMTEINSAAIFSILFIHLLEDFVDKLKYLRDLTNY